MRPLFAVAPLIVAAWWACQPPGAPCTTTATCGPTQACLADQCVEVECRSGADCALEQFCSTEDYTCQPGCSTSDDCLIGDRCDALTATCVPRSCTDTQLHCSLGERCNTATGVCELDPSGHCAPCSDSRQCGDGGICVQIDGRGGNCILPCSPEAFDPCPAGLQCSAQSTIDGQPDGFRCVGLCNAD